MSNHTSTIVPSIIGLGLCAALLGGVGGMALLASEIDMPFSVSTRDVVALVPCEEEDTTDTDCYWDASERGTTTGRDFVVIDGQVYYTEG